MSRLRPNHNRSCYIKIRIFSSVLVKTSVPLLIAVATGLQAQGQTETQVHTPQNSLSPQDELAVGRLYFATEDFPEAVEHFNSAIKADSNNGLLYFERGRAYYRLNQYIQAVPDYTRSLQLKYTPSVNYERRAYCYLNSKQYAKGISDCSEAIKNDPQSRIAYYNRAKAYHLIGEFEKAKTDRAKIKELDKHPRAKDFCDRCQTTHDAGERIAFCKAALKLDPDYAQAYMLMGASYLDLGKKQPAYECFNKLIAADPKNLTAYADRGLCRLDFASYKDALSDLNLVLEKASNCHQAYYWRGECYSGLNDSKNALADFDKSIKIMLRKMASEYAKKEEFYRNDLGRTLASAYTGQAHAYEKEGKLDLAIRSISIAIKGSSHALNALSELLPERAALYKKAGRNEEMHRDLLDAKAVADKIDEIKNGPQIPPPPMRKSAGAAAGSGSGAASGVGAASASRAVTSSRAASAYRAASGGAAAGTSDKTIPAKVVAPTNTDQRPD